MGAVSKNIRLQFQFLNTDSETQSTGRTYSFARSSKLQQWNYICLDMHKLVSEDSWVKSRVSSTPNFKLDYVAVYRDGSGNEDALIDDVWIGSADLSGRLSIYVGMKKVSFRLRCCIANFNSIQ